MKVKQLEWEEKYSTECYKSLIDKATGLYHIVISHEGIIKPNGETSSIKVYSVSIKKDFQEEFNSLKEAKGFCQNHFKEFILSQIEVKNES